MVVNEKYMFRCLQLASYGKGYVAPNPLVGAVLVYQDRVIGEGWHKKFGMPHAEVNCINSVSEEDKSFIKDAVLYVSLEPCCHTGKTPPCTDLIIRQGIKKVVVACKDPFGMVNGGGIHQLKSHGVEVVEGVLEKEAKWLNKHFFTFHLFHRPYILLKWAQTADGFMAGQNDTQRLMITGKTGNIFVHELRSEYAAIIIGTRTALLDNPRLTNRLIPGHSPVRIIIDKQLIIPLTHHLLNDGKPTIVINEVKKEKKDNLEYVMPDFPEQPLLQTINSLLYLRGLNSLMVEGGKKFLDLFISSKNWDEACVITAMDKRILEGLKSPLLHNVHCINEIQLENDEVKVFLPNI
ncbi:MAG: bifunctional diaminohydroxyphosphoribosylaminopyrimidine deaminase/5-amino-6-(5-phosphoribosylamino)uracil reductase RibD [Ferruginibacter sp.]|nr:bifunctional diaminohydroxyphosphoribosylaminopyrimidine deaminase/5-amino-6-(5-phosphoribosylamino)uracil reductase RibD [Ferruginibacter sp.]